MPGYIGRVEAIALLWNDTQLSAADVSGAMWILERAAGFPAPLLAVQAAAWIGYKVHSTCPYEKLSDFAQHVFMATLEDGIQAQELHLLQRVGFAVPCIDTTLHHVYVLGRRQGLDDAELDRGMVLSCLEPTMCASMDKDQLARCIVFAAAYKAGKLVTDLATETVSDEVIFHFGLKLGRH